MKKLITISFLLFSINFVHSDDHLPQFFPMEGVQCKYNKGKDLDDLLKVVSKWNDYMDQSVEAGNPNYSAYLLTPYMISGDEFDFDFVWLGAWENFASLSGITQYLSEASDIQKAFDKVSTCETRQLAPTLNVRTLNESNENTEGNIVQIRSCKNIGTPQETLQAYAELSSRLDAAEADIGIWLLVKGAGSPSNSDYDFLQMNVSTSSAWGNTLEKVWNGNAFQGMELADKVDCGPSRIYVGRALRSNNN